MWRYAAAISLAMVVAPTIGKCEWTVTELLSYYDASQPAERQNVEQMIAQTANGLGWANSYLENVRQEKALFCHPKLFVLSGSQIIDMLRREVEKIPSSGKSPFGLGVLMVNAKVFPC